ncbi:ligase-associated DNA damage response endonuclease PdeM [Yoonia sp. SS1-5]|uniref:Ligase-associated DNA damage response endonuclease PdeM n=1 Tax=Yoonia rhodophyticola TaxID=3137370 RepID=A0ABZ3JCU8_9RHOB
MNGYRFTFCDVACLALPSGGLYLPAYRVLCVSDLHLGKSDRIARRSGIMLPPYEVHQTLQKLEADIAATTPDTVICLGDSFDDMQAADSMDEQTSLWLAGMQAGRDWIWIEGNHDPGPLAIGGTHRAEYHIGGLAFRHIATPAPAEVSGHYHPKHRLAGRSRPAFLLDATRLILPAYGAYTGGLDCNNPALRCLFGDRLIAVLTGNKAIATPVTKTPQPAPFRGRSY